MYTQGNHNPQPRQGPPKPISSPYQQLPPGPPAPLPQFQQAPSGFTSYQHGPAAPHQIRPGGLPNTGHSYPHPPAHVHAGAPLPHMYPPAPHTSQHHLHLGTQNVHNMPQPLCRPPINASYPEVSQGQPPFRALPPPPPPPPQPQGQTFYRATVNAPPQQQGLQHISSHPPLPPTSSFFTSAPLGSFVQSTGGDHVPSTSSLPPPPPLPPNLPYPPPSTSTVVSSSKPAQYVSDLPCNLESDGFKLSSSGSVDEVVAPNQVKNNLETDNSSLNMRGRNECDMDSLVGDKIPLQEGLTVDLSSTPPKPTDENVIEKIEALCQSIAKNGPDYEDMVRKNESGNPDYAFLYGGEPGSEATIAHNFFLWMKKKNIFSCKSDEQHGVSSLRPSEKEFSEQPFHFFATGSHLPDDSDMEMEDDITQIDDDQGRNQSLESLNSQCIISDNTLKVEEQVHPAEISRGCNAFKSTLPETISAAGSSRLGQECITNVDQLAFEASVSEVNVVKSTVPTKGGSPFRLLQDYASDDNSEKDVETHVEKRNVAANLGGDFGSSLESAASLCQPEKGFGPVLNMPYEVANSEVVERTITTSIKMGNEHADNKHIQQVSANHAASVEVLQEENIMVGDSVESVKFSQEHKKEEEKLTLGSQHKVDKFGRLVRNGGSDSGSDDSDYTGRHRRGRTRSRSRSRSPPDRRKRRSPRRRKKRSVSRSWSPRRRRSRSRSPKNRRSRSRSPRNRRSRSRSPRNRRSRSRSPYLRRADEFSGENKRRVKGQMQFCFDFRRGRCYRGRSCRFLHQDSCKSDESRRQRSTGQHLEFPHTSRTNVQDETNLISEKAVDHEHGEVRGPEVKLCGKFVASRDGNTNLNREDSVGGSVCKQDGQSTEYHLVKSEEFRDIQGSVLETNLVENMKGRPDLVSIENCSAQQSGNLSISDSSHKTAASSPNRLRESNAHPNTMELHNHPSHIDNPDTKQLQTASSMFHSSGESFPSYMLPDQQSYFALQPESSLASLPPPPLRPQDSTKTPVFSSHFQQSQLPLRNDFGSQMIPKPYPTALPAHSQSDGFQQRAFIPIQEANRPFIHTPSPVCNLPAQQLGAPSMSRDDGLTHPPTQNMMASNSFTQGNTFPHTMPINKIQPFPSESLRPVGLSDSSSYIHPYPQKQQPPHSFPHPVTDHIYNLAGKMNSSLEDPPDIKDATSHHIDIGVSTSSTFPNSYAPTLDQPINSKYHSHVLQEQGTTYNSTPFSLTHPPVDGKGIGLQQATSSPNSARTVGQNSSRSGGDQYDPLFDSFEPSTRLSRKVDYMQKLEVTGDSGILLGLSGSNEPLDMEEKNKDAEAITSAASADNEEFGETADAEVGAVENESPSHPVEVNMATSEIEIDQIKSPGKSKKSKDSRSMKHFKVAIADFVKEVLKPSWQQGNMSKEAFKTIVKKTVDKVSGAMKNHQIPKSRAKIDHYIESSQRKLTKLVMGYVDKYVKV